MPLVVAEGLLGRAAGNYTLVQAIGHGGMGDVFLGINPALEARVAVKVLHATAGAADGSRFLNEARAVNRIHHEGVAKILDGGFLDVGRPYLVMELLEGESLGAVLARTPRLEMPRALGIECELLDIVGAAHEVAIVHRDLKPENVFLGPAGRVTILDFGVAKLLDGSTSVTRTGAMVGTPAYMAPEQIHAATIDGRADLYALGVMLYEMLVGVRPFTGPTPFAIVQAHTSAPIPRLPPGAPPGLQAVIDRALAKQPEQRFGSAAEMRAALAPFAAPGQVAAKAPAPGRRGRTRVIGALAVLVVAAGGVAIIAASRRSESTADSAAAPAATVARSAEFEAEWRPIHDEMVRELDRRPSADIAAIKKKMGEKTAYLKQRYPAFRALSERFVAQGNELNALLAARDLLDSDLPTADEDKIVRAMYTLDFDDAVTRMTGLIAAAKVLPIDRALVSRKYELARTRFEAGKAGHPDEGVAIIRTRLEAVQVLVDKGDNAKANHELQEILAALQLWEHSVAAPRPRVSMEQGQRAIVALEAVMRERKLILSDLAEDTSRMEALSRSLASKDGAAMLEIAGSLVERARVLTIDREMLTRKRRSVAQFFANRRAKGASSEVAAVGKRLDDLVVKVADADPREFDAINTELYELDEQIGRWGKASTKATDLWSRP